MFFRESRPAPWSAATDSGKKTYTPDPKPVKKPKKGKRGK